MTKNICLRLSFLVALFVTAIQGAWAYNQDTYWLVVTKADGTEIGQFEFSASRNRTGSYGNGATDYRHFTLGMKDDDLQRMLTANGINDKKMYYYIKNTNASTKVRPYQETYELGKIGNPGTHLIYPEISGVYQEWYKDIKKNSETGHLWLLTLGERKSYSWFLDIDSNYRLALNSNGQLLEDPNKTFYLIGNFKSATGGEAWVPSDPNYRLKMDRIIYPVGASESEADSIVYSVTVNRPANGWKDFYIGVIAEHRLTDGWDNSANGDWKYVVRPEIDPIPVKNVGTKDAVALHGCLWVPTNGAKGTHDASLNPTVDDAKESYTFTMNVTTSTYRIAFHDGLYIMGDAIDGWEQEKAKKLEYDQTEGCWKVNVNMKKNGKFRFANDKSMRDCYGENAAVPGEVNTDDEVKGDNVDNYETQYVNMLKWFDTGVVLHKDITTPIQPDGCGDIVFLLPDGNYDIRFYANGYNVTTNQVQNDKFRIYYTIDRKFDFVAPKANNAVNMTTYKYFKPFSNYHTMTRPEGVDMFIVSDVQRIGDKIAVTLKDMSDRQYIPANTGVILASKEPFSTPKLSKSVNLYYAEPWRQPETVTNLLKPSVVSRHVETTEGDKTNYIFGYKKLSASDNGVTIGFFVPGAGNLSANSAYLQIPSSLSAGAKQMVLMFDGGVVSGINLVSRTPDVQSQDDACYTLQGVRIGRPVTKGIYVKNGKKFVVK